jgi:hypothetical protein
MTYRCENGHEFERPSSRCYLNQTPRYCRDRDVYGGRGECSCTDGCPDCGTEDFDEIEEEAE